MRLRDFLFIFFISMVPVVELRGAIPYAAVFGVDIWQAALVAVVGNLLPVPLILFGMDLLLRLFGQTKWLGPILNRFVARAEKKAQSMGNVELLGLAIFVGIPLPGTGAWTGAMISSVLKLPRRKSIFAIFLGLIMSATIMCVISYLLPGLFAQLF